MTAPFGRRLCEVAENRASGGYRVFSLLDREGPEPRAGPVLHARHRAPLGAARRAPLPAAGALGRRDRPGRRRRPARLPDRGRSAPAPTGSASWRRARASGSTARSATPSRPRASSRPDAAGAILVGGGIGIAPLALLRRRFAARERPHPRPARLPRRGPLRRPRRPLLLLRGPPRQRRRPRRPPRLRHRPARGDARGRRRRPAPPSTPAARRRCSRRCAALCAERGVACELAMESPMACGYGACFGCAVPKPGGGYMRLCVDGPVVRGDQVAEVAACLSSAGSSWRTR